MRKWLFFLKYAKQLKAIPEVIREEAIREAFEIVNALHWDKETLHLYSMRNIYVQDEIHRVGFGYKKGQSDSQYTIARKMLTKGMPPEIVAEYTRLSLDVVKTLF